MTRKLLNAAMTVLCLCVAAVASGETDYAGSADHPMFSRYPGSHIRNYSFHEFDQSDIAIAFKDKSKPGEPVKQTFEGKTTTVIYEMPGTISALQVFRNYEQAFAQAGLKVLLNCFNQSCGSGLPIGLFRGGNKEQLYRSMLYDSIHRDNADFGYLSATGTANGAPITVGVFVAKIRTTPVGWAGLDVIEAAPLKTGLIAVDPNNLQKSIQEQGKAVLSGIYFDTDKDVVKPESDKALLAITEYLKKSQQNFFVVGHSDNAGSYEHNLDLSRRRAQAVVNVLTSKHGVAKTRLTPIGIGPVSPSGSNANDAGRERNRRVELVLR